MIERKPIVRIQTEYRSLLAYYEKDIRQNNISNTKLKALFTEVEAFWYKNKSAIRFFLNNLDYHDDVAFLAGAVHADAKNCGHIEFSLLGTLRIINDPLSKMSAFFKSDGLPINYARVRNYVNTVTMDMLDLMDNCGDQFIFIPTDSIVQKDHIEQIKELSKIANNCLLAAFDYKYESIATLIAANPSYESIEKEANPNALSAFVYTAISDTEIPLRKRIEQYCSNHMDYIVLRRGHSEAQIFVMFTTQYIMQCLDIFLTASEFKITPYIRSDVIIAYLSLLEPIVTQLIDPEALTKCIIAYLAQTLFDFTTYTYEEFLNKFGNGILVNKVLLALKDKGTLYPIAKPSDIAKHLDYYYHEILTT